MGNVEGSVLQAEGDQRLLLLRLVQEASQQMVDDAARAVEERTRSWMENCLGSVNDRIRRLEEAIREVDERHETRMREMVDRLNQLEQRQSCPTRTSENPPGNLEERVTTLEQSVDRAFQSVLPRVEILVNQLGGYSSSMESTTTETTSAINPTSTNLFPTPPPDLVPPFPSGVSWEQSFTAACQEGRIEDVQRLLDAGVNIESIDSCGVQGLHWAVRRKHLDIVRLLLHRGADVHARTKFGWTALHVAAKTNCRKSICYLLNAGSDVNCRDNNGWTPLHWAATEENDVSIRLLLAAGASPDVRDNFGMLPLDLAGTENITKLLKQRTRVEFVRF